MDTKNCYQPYLLTIDTQPMMAYHVCENHVSRNFAYYPTESHQDQITELFLMALAKNHARQQLIFSKDKTTAYEL